MYHHVDREPISLDIMHINDKIDDSITIIKTMENMSWKIANTHFTDEITVKGYVQIQLILCKVTNVKNVKQITWNNYTVYMTLISIT